jgi:hypothetical protein
MSTREAVAEMKETFVLALSDEELLDLYYALAD